MKVGVTGTREGWTPAQHVEFAQLIATFEDFTEFHHGSCRGVDVQAAFEVFCFRECIFQSQPKIICHPGPPDDTNREDSKVDDVILPPKNHFARNRDIVDAVDLLVVVPRDTERQERGGTWMSFDYAVKKRRPVKVIWPDGTVTDGVPK